MAMSSWFKKLSHRSTVYSGGYAILWQHGSTVYSGGYAILWQYGSTMYDWWPWPLFMMSSVYDLSIRIPTSELVYMIFCRCLDVCRFPIRCALGSWHTHAAYKVYRLSLVPISDFGGHSVIHNFGRHDDVMMIVNSSSSLEKLPLSLSRNHIF